MSRQMSADEALCVIREAGVVGERACEAYSVLSKLVSESVPAEEADRYRLALEEIREMMGPANRQQFVMRGALAFAGVWNVVESALTGSKTGT